MNTANNEFELVRLIWQQLSHKRKFQFAGLMALMVLGAISEFLLVGIVGKFLSVMTRSDELLNRPSIGLISELSAFFGVEDTRLFVTFLFCGIVIASASIRTTLLWANSHYGMQIGYDFSSKIYANVVCSSYEDHLNSTSSREIAAVDKVQGVIVGVIIPLLRALTAAIVTTFILASLCFLSPALALTALGIVGGFYFLAVFSTRKLLIRNSRHIAAARTVRVRMVQEGVAGIRDIIISGLQECYQKRFNKVESDFRFRLAINAFLSEAPRYLIELVLLISVAVGVLLFIESGKGIDNLIPLFCAFSIGVLRLFPLLQTIYRAHASVSGTHGLINDVLKSASADRARHYDRRLPIQLTFSCSIELINLSFRYHPESFDVLSNVNITIHKGQFVNIVGSTGSGKSTLVDLLLGLLSPTSGKISIDGEPLVSRELIAGWWENIAHVPQDIFLVEASVAQNIALGSDEHAIDEGRILEAIRIAELTDVVGRLPQGIYTTVGERGANFSGGQRQRIGIARAIYLRRPVLVLDEATSSLDSETESHVLKNIRSIKGITVISITHHPTSQDASDITFNVCDRLVSETCGIDKAKS